MANFDDQPLPGETTPPPPEQEQGGVPPASGGQEKSEPNEAERALVRQWMARIKKAKSRWAPVFKRMRDDMAFSQGKQWPQMQEEDTRYVCNITLRQVNQKVASLYAKNPTTIATRRKTSWGSTRRCASISATNRSAWAALSRCRSVASWTR